VHIRVLLVTEVGCNVQISRDHFIFGSLEGTMAPLSCSRLDRVGDLEESSRENTRLIRVFADPLTQLV
jgi:hypothetical protein